MAALRLSMRAVLAAACLAALAACGKQDDAPAPPAPPIAAGQDQLLRGRYLVQAADCAACHTAEGGAPFAGGVPLESPFGKFYGTNITPDAEHGIGDWSADDFYAALHDGMTPDGPLYPAMPYTSYRQLSRADSDAMYAYLRSIKPAAVPNREPELDFPYNMRFGVRFWNWLFLEDSLPDASQGGSQAWLRGRYLAGALGHCAECHTPRGKLGQLDPDRPLQGGALGRILAPDISPAGLAGRGWTADDLDALFATGIAPQGAAFDEMFPVVHLSTQYLSREDVTALSTYLLGDHPPAPARAAPATLEPRVRDSGKGLYVALCAGCHGFDGQGKPGVAVAMQGNTALRDSNPHNLVAVMLDGIEAQDFPGTAAMQAMPGFAGTLTDAQAADLANYLRAEWGGQAPTVTAESVQALRR
ncbi:c-type cytochrome [Bordetella petrii]|uniref:c-type cytochrome n=1 Tax=Bordetella petrii TaxID=94624 RepID=UPI003730BB11